MKKPVRSIVLLAVLAAACDGSTLPAVTGSEGALRVDLAGARSASFGARGDGTGIQRSEYAVGGRSNGWIGVQAAHPNADGSQTRIAFTFPERTAPYTITFDWTKCAADLDCPGGIAYLDAPPGNPDGGNVFSFSKGEIRVTRISNGRVRGTFSGSGAAMNASTGALRYLNGSFDVPVVDRS